MGEGVIHSSLYATLPRGARKSQTPRRSKVEIFIPPILKFVGTRSDALVEVATQVTTLIIAQMEQFENMGVNDSTPMLTGERIEEVVIDASPTEPL